MGWVGNSTAYDTVSLETELCVPHNVSSSPLSGLAGPPPLPCNRQVVSAQAPGARPRPPAHPLSSHSPSRLSPLLCLSPHAGPHPGLILPPVRSSSLQCPLELSFHHPVLAFPPNLFCAPAVAPGALPALGILDHSGRMLPPSPCCFGFLVSCFGKVLKTFRFPFPLDLLPHLSALSSPPDPPLLSSVEGTGAPAVIGPPAVLPSDSAAPVAVFLSSIFSSLSDSHDSCSASFPLCSGPPLTLLASWPGADMPPGLAEKGSPWRRWDPVFLPSALPSASFSFPLVLSWGRDGPYSFQGRTSRSASQSLSRDRTRLPLLLAITPML